MTPPPRHTILLVDDDPFVSRLTARRLTRQGWTVRTASSGQEALAALRGGEAFSLVLLDRVMPGLDGLETLRRIRRTRSREELPVIMLTAKGDPPTLVEALAEGADDFVSKPADGAVLGARVRAQLARRDAMEALRRSEERYALAARGANDGLWDLDLRRGELYLSPRFLELMRETPGETSEGEDPDRWVERVHPADRERVARAFADHLAGASAHVSVEHRARGGDGVYRWVLLRGAGERGPDGTVGRLAGSLTDLSRPHLHDGATGLPNRALLLDRIEAALRRGRRSGLHTAVLVVGLERTDRLRDRGADGDALLRGAVDRLRAVLRETDTVSHAEAGSGRGAELARLDGSMFALCCSELPDPAAAARIGRRLVAALSEPLKVAGRPRRLRPSVGVRVAPPGAPEPQALVSDAMSALASARADGAGWALFDPEVQARADALLELETDLARALERDQLRLHYQPVVDLRSGRIRGVEALVRWQCPQRGMIPPGSFIPLLEQSGGIVGVGTWVLHTACRELLSQRRRLGDIRLAVNVSPVQLRRVDLPAVVDEVLRATGFPANRLEVELTEGVLVENMDEVGDGLAALRRRGVRVALDDFGTGYSSLRYLSRLPIDTLKIDRSFTAGLEERPDDAAIAAATVAIARQLGLEVVAEGVETSGQATRLRALGCRLAQGYRFGRPVPLQVLGARVEGSPSDAVTLPFTASGKPS